MSSSPSYRPPLVGLDWKRRRLPRLGRPRSFRPWVVPELAIAAALLITAEDLGARGRSSESRDDRGAAFNSEASESMSTMMRAMHAERGADVDHAFVQMMVPHHQAAIDMATSMLRYGTNPCLRRIAQEIVIEQQQEIVAMNRALAGEGQQVPSDATVGPVEAAPR